MCLRGWVCKFVQEAQVQVRCLLQSLFSTSFRVGPAFLTEPGVGQLGWLVKPRDPISTSPASTLQVCTTMPNFSLRFWGPNLGRTTLRSKHLAEWDFSLALALWSIQRAISVERNYWVWVVSAHTDGVKHPHTLDNHLTWLSGCLQIIRNSSCPIRREQREKHNPVVLMSKEKCKVYSNVNACDAFCLKDFQCGALPILSKSKAVKLHN